MLTAKEEYISLRQELMEHQSRRLIILNVALTICLALFTASWELRIPLLSLLALIALIMARIQIAQAQYGIARIASYIRIILEADNPSLNWETGSYWIRQKSQNTQTKENFRKKVVE